LFGQASKPRFVSISRAVLVAYPRWYFSSTCLLPHASPSLPAVEAVSLKPMLFSQVPVLDTVLTKLSSFVGAVNSWSSSGSNSKGSGQAKAHQASLFPTCNPAERTALSMPGDPHAMGTGNVCTCGQASPSISSALLDPATGTWISSSSLQIL
jgi:hypothetical protein